jgi:hypothetical protein
MSLTSSFIAKAGVVEITLDTTVFTGSDTFQVLELGDIEYDLDVTSYGDVINNLGAMYNRTKLVVGLYTGANQNLFDLLYDEFLVAGSLSSQKVNVNIVITSHSLGNPVYRFRYEIRANGLKFTENMTKLTLELDPFIDTSLTVSGVFFGVGQRNAVREQIGGATVTVTGIMTGSFIRYTVSGLNTSLPTIHEPAFTNSGLAGLTFAIPTGGAPPAGINSYVLSNSSFTTGGASGLALDHVAKFAVLGGDFYGTGFDFNFYVNRLRTDRVRAVNFDEIESLTYQFTPSPYRSITLSFDGNANLRDYSTILPGNQFAEKSVSGFYSVSGMFIKAQYIPASGYAYINYTGNLSADIEAAITNSGILAHQKALNAQDVPLIRVEATLFGFDKVKPYEAVQFTGDVPDKYKFTTGTNPRYFRPTSMSYSLMDDKVKLKMYSIN